ncbi:hypothetical protein [Novosphingobium sp.]|uniref:Vgb family protein n=1 Tax=Novosphingobium sp. TaxID=1874826 RepID=UPI003BAD9D7A
MIELYALSLGMAEIHRFDAETGAALGVQIDVGKDGVQSPDGLAITQEGLIIVSGYHSDTIVAYHPDGTFARVVCPAIRRPTTGLVDRDGFLLVGGFGEEGESQGAEGRDAAARAARCQGPHACTIARFDPRTGEFCGTFAQGGGLNGPDGVHYGPDGNLYVSSFRGDQVLRFDGATGAFIDVFAEHPELDGASGLLFVPDGRLLICSWYTGQILSFDAHSGAFLGQFGSGQIEWPNRLALGPDGTLFVASLATNSIARFSLSGEPLGQFAEIPHPTDLVFVHPVNGVMVPI